MKKISLLFVLVLLAACLKVEAQVKGEAFTPANYNVLIDQKIIDATRSAVEGEAVAVNVLNSMGAGVKRSESNELHPLQAYANEAFFELAQKRFKEELGITIKPLNTLEGKVNYRDDCPRMRKLKKAAKKAPGETYYLSFFAYMYKPGFSVNVTSLERGKKLKPNMDLKLELANAKGKVVDEIELKKIKTDIVVVETRGGVGNVKMGKKADEELIKENMLAVYNDALTKLIEKFKKEHKKEYRD